jgi:hypothetical protein
VSITSPSNGDTVSGTTTVTATASDNVGVVGVQFKLDGANLGAEVTTAPYSISWDTTTASNGSHTLTAVARDAAGNTAASAGVTVTVSNGGGGGTTTRFEETSPAITYTGTWSPPLDSPPGASGGTYKESNEAGARATLSFTGTQVTWISGSATVTGIANVYLDGSLVATIDTYSPTLQTQVKMYTSPVLSPGTHTLTIEATGTKNPSSGNAWVVVDAFDVTS